MLFFYMYTHPGTKLLFMGGEFGQTSEWNFNQSLDWHLLQFSPHLGLHNLVRSLNELYKKEPALYEISFRQEGFQWIESGDADNSVLVYMRKGFRAKDNLLVVLNFTPMVHHSYRIGLPAAGDWEVLLSSDDTNFNGSGFGQEKVSTEPLVWMGQANSVVLNLPPLAGFVLKRINS